MVHKLLHTVDGMYDQACGLDYFWLGFYDTWVMRDRWGKTVRPLFPYFRAKADRDAVSAGQPIPVNSCWNGITVFDGRWFSPFSHQTTTYISTAPAVAALTSPSIADDGKDISATLPLRFRPCNSCNVSEALLTSLDMHRLSSPHRPRIFVNPQVTVAYNYPSFYLYRNIMHWYVTQPWRFFWETWMERRLFSWLADLGNRRDECATLLQSLWVPWQNP